MEADVILTVNFMKMFWSFEHVCTITQFAMCLFSRQSKNIGD